MGVLAIKCDLFCFWLRKGNGVLQFIFPPFCDWIWEKLLPLGLNVRSAECSVFHGVNGCFREINVHQFFRLDLLEVAHNNYLTTIYCPTMAACLRDAYFL